MVGLGCSLGVRAFNFDPSPYDHRAGARIKRGGDLCKAPVMSWKFEQLPSQRRVEDEEGEEEKELTRLIREKQSFSALFDEVDLGLVANTVTADVMLTPD